LGAARNQPTVLAIEDLHWADPSTLEVFTLLVQQGATSRLLLLYTARPEFRFPWPQRANHTQINLNRLSEHTVLTMVKDVAAQKELSDATVATVLERSGGVPLFVEELTRAVLESGDALLTGLEIPATLNDLLMARMDRLGPAKEVAQVGAVIGSEFSYELLHATHPVDEARLENALQKLVHADLLYARGVTPHSTYQFKHVLVRDAAYAALLKSRRRELHKRIAQNVETFAQIVDAQPELAAHHFTEVESLIERYTTGYWLHGRPSEGRRIRKRSLT
jgi:predicted ATPase